jgi:hypothetical protein
VCAQNTEFATQQSGQVSLSRGNSLFVYIYIYKAARCSLQDLKRFYSMLSLFVLHRIFRRLTDSAGFAGLQI